MLKNHKCIVFGIEHYTALGIVRSLGREGIFPDLIAVKGKSTVVSSSKYISRVHFVNSIEEGYSVLLNEYGGAANINNLPVVYCSDDKTIGFLDLHYDEIKNKFILFNAHKQGRITEYMDKFKILECAQKNGFNILETKLCKKGDIPDGIEYPVITKSISPNVGGWKSDVHICYSENDLKDAYNDIKADTVLIQKYIEKKNELCLDGLSTDKGTQLFVSIATTYNYLIKGYYSPYMTVKNFDNERIYESLRKIFSAIGFDGIFSVEFLIDENDNLYFSEINFRVSTWSWASTMSGMNLPYLWGEIMTSGNVTDNIYKAIPDDFTAMVEPIDYGKRVDTGKITPAEWLADFKNANVTYYYDMDDPEPFFIMMRNWERMK